MNLAGCHCACLYDSDQTNAHVHAHYPCIPVYTNTPRMCWYDLRLWGLETMLMSTPDSCCLSRLESFDCWTDAWNGARNEHKGENISLWFSLSVTYVVIALLLLFLGDDDWDVKDKSLQCILWFILYTAILLQEGNYLIFMFIFFQDCSACCNRLCLCTCLMHRWLCETDSTESRCQRTVQRSQFSAVWIHTQICCQVRDAEVHHVHT